MEWNCQRKPLSIFKNFCYVIVDSKIRVVFPFFCVLDWVIIQYLTKWTFSRQVSHRCPANLVTFLAWCAISSAVRKQSVCSLGSDLADGGNSKRQISTDLLLLPEQRLSCGYSAFYHVTLREVLTPWPLRNQLWAIISYSAGSHFPGWFFLFSLKLIYSGNVPKFLCFTSFFMCV